ITSKHRSIIIITSNNEKELPDAFLRRCFFHYIEFPDKETMRQIIDVHYPNIQEKLINEALAYFYDLRSIDGLKKKPSTSELIDWLKLLSADDLSEKTLAESRKQKDIPPHIGALLKNEQDISLLNHFSQILKNR
ncbi:MAG: ATP-binding protein, partial [Neisseriaceae bacterium]|nr:ATP-binding protein [Neisseriaceae bacterium]